MTTLCPTAIMAVGQRVVKYPKGGHFIEVQLYIAEYILL